MHQGIVEGEVFIIDIIENSQRHLEDSRTGRESSRLNMASSLDQVMRGERKGTREKDKESVSKGDQGCAQPKQQGSKDHEKLGVGKPMVWKEFRVRSMV